MNKKHIAIGMVVVVVIICAILSVAMASNEYSATKARKPGNTPFGRLIKANLGRLMTMRAELNLSEEQREKIKIVIQKYRPDIKSIAQTIVQNRRALREAVLAEKRDEATIRKSAEDLGKSIGDAALIASRIANDVRPILTAGQIDRIKQFNAEKDGAVDNWLNEMAKPSE